MPYRIVPINWIQWLTLLLLLAVAIVTPIEFTRIHDVQHHQNDALHSIICFVETRELQSPVLSAAKKQQSIRFWSTALREAHLQPCD